MRDAISVVAIIGALTCLFAFLYLALSKIPAATTKADQKINRFTQGKAFAEVEAKDLAEIVKALAAFAEALVKAGPAFWALMGSLLFLVIACTAAGVFA